MAKERTDRDDNVERTEDDAPAPTIRTYRVTIVGLSPLLMHRDNIEAADAMAAWLAVPENKKGSRAGDDRTPAFTWIARLYEDNGLIAMPSDNLMTMLREGGAMVSVPKGKKGKTFKAQTQSGMLIAETGWPLIIDGNTIEMSKIAPLLTEMNFAVHQRTAIDLGFSLFVKRARIGQSKHIRVRPKFSRWELRGHLNVWDDEITTESLVTIFRMGGEYKGLSDWRASSRTPGQFGRFKAEIVQVS